MAIFRNVSGVSLDLMLPEWYAAKTVEPGSTVDVDDELAVKYDFDQPGVWQRIDAAAPVPPVPVPAPEPPAPAPASPVAAPATNEGE